MQHNVIELSEFRKNRLHPQNSNKAANTNDRLVRGFDVKLPQ